MQVSAVDGNANEAMGRVICLCEGPKKEKG
jgi:hypothetical protein